MIKCHSRNNNSLTQFREPGNSWMNWADTAGREGAEKVSPCSSEAQTAVWWDGFVRQWELSWKEGGRCEGLATGKMPGSRCLWKSLAISRSKSDRESTKGGFCSSSAGLFTLVMMSLLDFVGDKDPIAQWPLVWRALSHGGWWCDFKYFSVLIWSAGDGTQGLVHGWEMLYHRVKASD